MCGLVGYFTNFMGDVDRERFKFLMYLSATRGHHSAGVMGLVRHGAYNAPKDVRYTYFKSPVHPAAFIETPEVNNLLKWSDTKGFMGHTRAATMGAINSANAHPFVSENGLYVGAHNGTLYGDFPGKAEGKTDSEYLINLLSEKGAKGLSDVSGAWALTYLDAEHDTFNIIRNNDRPISYVVTQAGDFAYASEAWMLEAMLKKYGQTGKVENLPAYERLQLDLSKQEYIKTLDVSKVEGLEAPKVTTRQSSFFQGEGPYDEWDFWGQRRGWESNEPEVQTHRRVNGPRDYAGPQATVGGQRRTPGVGLIGTSRPPQITQQKGTEKTPKAQGVETEDGASAGSSASTGSSGVSSKRGVGDNSNPRSRKRLLAGLHERQRVQDGDIQIETFKDNWISIETFLDLIDTQVCKWSDEGSSLADERIWVNRDEFILKSVYDNDPECKHVLGDLSTALIRQ